MSGQLIGRGYITIAGLKDGDPAKTYVLVPSVESVTKKLDGTLSAASVSCSVYKVTGSSAYALTADHTLSYVRTPDGTAGTLAHASGTSPAVTVLADTESIEFELSDGTNVIDRVRVPVLSDATDVNDELDTYKYLKESLRKQGTAIQDGLVLSSLIALGYTDDAGVRHTMAGTNGIYVPSLGGRTIGSWWGGPMVDLFDANDVRKNLTAGSYATSLIRMDGTGYFVDGLFRIRKTGLEIGDTANGYGISMGMDGRLIMGNGININIGGSAQGLAASIESVTTLANKLSNLFTPYLGNTPKTWAEVSIPGTHFDSVKVNVGLWTDSFLSCLGKSDTGGSGSTGGGLVESIYRWADLGGTFSDADNDTFNAYTLNRIYSELTAADSAISARLANFYTKSEADTRYALANTLSGYVKKAGDTMTGTLTVPGLKIVSGYDAKIIIDNTDDETYWNFISFRDKGVEYGRLGTQGGTNISWNGNAIFHGGNYASVLDQRYLLKSAYTAADVLAKLKGVDGPGSGLDADLLDGYHASLSTVASTVPVRDSDGLLRLPAVRNSGELKTRLYDAGWYRAFTSDMSDAQGDNILLSVSRMWNLENNEAYHFSISVRTYMSGYKPCITQLSGTFSTHLITKIRVVQKFNSIFYIDFYYEGGNNEVVVSGFGKGIFCAPVAATIPDGYTAIEFDTVQGFKCNEELAANAASATKLADNTAFKAWGQTFFENGKPKNVSGNLSGVGSISASGEIKSTAPNGFRIAYANYGLILRNDGNNSYFLLTDSGDANGSFNSLRPFLINNSTGRVSMNNGMSTSTATISGLLAAHGGVQIGADADTGWYRYSSRITAGNATAKGVNVGSLLVSNAWADGDKVPANGIYIKGALRIGDITIEEDKVNGGLHVSGGGLYADTFISALGVNPNDGNTGGGGSGMSYDRLDAWADYSADKAGYVLSALLGNDLYQNKLGKTEAQSLYQPKGSYVTLNTAQTISGSKTFSNGFKSHYGGGSWISMATRTTQILGDSDNTTSNAHSLFMLKNSSGSAVAYGGLGVSIGFYGFTKARIDANTNGTDWSTVWNVNDGTLTHSAAFVANTIKKAGGTSSQFLKADGSVDGNSYLLSSVYTASDVLNKLKTVDGAGSGLDSDLLDGYHETVFVRDRDLGSRGDYQHVVFLLWKDSEIANHHIQGKLFTMSSGSLRYQAAAIDIWFSRWSATGYDWKGRFDTWGLGTMMRLVTCTYNGEKWWAVEHTNTHAINLYFTGTARNVAWTKVHYYTSNTSTVVNSEIYSSREAVDVGTYTVNGIRNALVSDTVANASALGGISASEYLTKSNYAATLDGRYYTETEINTKLTDGSVTKVGTATIGSATRPVYLNSGVPTACSYIFGNASGNAALNNGTVNTNLNADLLDGLHSTSFLTRKDAKCNETSINDLRLNMGSYDRNDFLSGQYFSEYPSPYGVYLSIVPRDRNCAAMLFIDSGLSSAAVDKRHVFVNTRNAGDGSTAFNGWQKLAYVDDNVASATKLQTARTLWGRSFDGTANVSGDMTGVGSITATGSISLSASSVLQFKEAGYGDKFGIWGDFNGFDDENRMYIGSATGASGTDPVLSAKLTMLLASGYIGLGTGSPTHRLHVNGYVRFNGLTLDGSHLLEWDAANTAWKFNGNLYATGGISALGITELSATEATVESLRTKSIILSTAADGNVSAGMLYAGTVMWMLNRSGMILIGDNAQSGSRICMSNRTVFGGSSSGSYYIDPSGDAVLKTLGVRGTIKTAASMEIRGAVFTVEGSEIYVTIGETKYKLTKTAVTA